MKSRFVLIFTMIIVASTAAAHAQIGNIVNKAKEKTKKAQTEKPGSTEAGNASPESPAGKNDHTDDEFLYIGRHDMDGKSISGMRACVPMGRGRNPPPASKQFSVWSDAISEVAALRSFNSSACQVMAFYIRDHPAYKYKNIDSLTETAQGHSIYKTDGGKLVLVRKIEATQFYIVVVPDHDKPGLKLSDLIMCGYPDTIKLFRRKVNTVSNCHDQKQKLYVFESYKNYPGPMQTSSVIFDTQEFETLRKQGKFRGLAMYKLVGETLEAVR